MEESKEYISDLVERWQAWLRIRTEKCKSRDELLKLQDSAIEQMGDDFLKTIK
jgi:hypothetical protein